MSTKKFPEYMYETVNLGGSHDLGTYSVSADGEFIYVMLKCIFYRTDLFTTEQIRVTATRSDFPGTPISSSYVTCANIEQFTDTNYWFGSVRFDFARQQLNTGTTVDLQFDTLNYTHSYPGTQIGTIVNYLDSNGAFDIVDTRAGLLTLFDYR